MLGGCGAGASAPRSPACTGSGRTRLSPIRFRTRSIRAECEISSKHAIGDRRVRCRGRRVKPAGRQRFVGRHCCRARLGGRRGDTPMARLPTEWLTAANRGILGSGLMMLICADVIRPSMAWLITRGSCTLTIGMGRCTRPAPGVQRLGRLRRTGNPAGRVRRRCQRPDPRRDRDRARIVGCSAAGKRTSDLSDQPIGRVPLPGASHGVGSQIRCDRRGHAG
jgi:hypothetical protein